MTTTERTAPEISDPIKEIHSTRETAEKIANEGPAEGSEVTRVLAGLIAHLAEQMEKLATDSPTVEPPAVQRHADDGR